MDFFKLLCRIDLQNKREKVTVLSNLNRFCVGVRVGGVSAPLNLIGCVLNDIHGLEAVVG